MKTQWIAACVLQAGLALPSSAFALQGENISFARLEDGGVTVYEFAFAETEGFEEGVGNVFDFDGDSVAQFSELLEILGRRLEASTSGAASDITCLVSGKLTTPRGTSSFVPNHCISATLFGSLRPITNIRAQASGVTYGEISACYATGTGLANPPTPLNTFATMDVFFHFLVIGSTKDTLQAGKSMAEVGIPILGIVQEREVGGFCQIIDVGDTSVSLVHMGDGVFVTSGAVAASTEKSSGNFTKAFDLTSECAVNHFWTARQRVQIDSEGAPEVNVLMSSSMGAGAQRIIFDNGEDDGGASFFKWTSLCSAFFFARDYCIEDFPLVNDMGNPLDDNGDPILDPDGNLIGPNNPPSEPGSSLCIPQKVLVDDGTGGIGTANIENRTVPVFRDLQTVEVTVFPGSTIFDCDLSIVDAKTGEEILFKAGPVADLAPSTGVAIFDLTPLGPIPPGYYRINVSSLYSAEAYVAIPGDADLNGQVTILGDATILIENLGVTSGATWHDADFNNDNAVDVLNDAFTIINNLGQNVCP